MARFDTLLTRRSASLDRHMGETWYLNELGSNVFVAVRVLINSESDRNDATNQLVFANQSKTIVVYKSVSQSVGGADMGGVARPIVDRHQFISSGDYGNATGVFWVVKEIVADDQDTWTLRCERSQVQRVGTTNVK